MRQLMLLMTLLLVPLMEVEAQRQNKAQQPANVMSSQVVHLGRTQPLRDLIAKPETAPEKKAATKAIRPPRNFIGRGAPVTLNPDALPQGEDRVRQSAMPQRRSQDGDISFLTNIEGLRAGGAPHDPSGDIGLDYYIQAVNVTRFQIFNKDGTAASNPIAANTLWQPLGRSSRGDPIVLYDQVAQRWYITEFPAANELMIAVSVTSDPFGAWDAYVFGTPSFPDYPKWSIWPNAIVVTSNETGPGEQTVYFIDREGLLNGEGVASVQRVGVDGVGNGPGFYVGTPVDWSGQVAPPAEAKPMILRQNDDAWGNVPKDQIDVIEFDVDFANPDNTTYTVKSLDTAPYDSNPCSEDGPGFGCIPQLGDNPIDGLPFLIMNQVHYQNFGTHESIVLNFITDATAGDKIAGIRWMELRRDPSPADTVGWTIYQEGTFAPDDGINRFMGAIAQDGQGNIALAYSTSSADEFPSLKVTGRFATDPLGVMTQSETTIIEGTGPITFGDRYGDYAQMSVDPFNGRTFWYTSEYGDEDGVTTRIIGFDLKKDTNDLSARTLISPEPISAANPTETAVTVLIKNVGIDSQTGFNVGFSFDNGEAVIESLPNVTLAPDSTYEHTFATPIDISELGTYSIKSWSDLATDDFRGNDTIRSTLRTLPAADVAVIEVDAPTSVCGTAAGVFVTLLNTSGRNLTSAVITISLDGEVVKTENWSGNLSPGGRVVDLIILTGLMDGEYELEAVASLPNGQLDEAPDDNLGTDMMTVLTNGDRFQFTLQLDNFPGETSWELVDEDDNVVASGDNYTQDFGTVEVQFCLDPNGCYTLNLFDSFGDGIFQNGGFTITNENGEVVADEGGDFGNVQSADFCASLVCLLEVEVDVALASGPDANDGTILLTLDNTNGQEFTVSFDGGPPSTNTLFTDLEPGTYSVVVSNGLGCEFTDMIEVGTCSLMATASAVDSSIVVTVDSGVAPFSYSLDGGDFQDDPEFLDLINGTYLVTVRDDVGCEVDLEVLVDDPNDVFFAEAGQKLVISPNPTDGVFKVEMTGLPNQGTLLPIEIYDAAGRLVQYNKMVRYDATYYGHFSLLTEPVGVYYLRIVDPAINRLLRIVKQ